MGNIDYQSGVSVKDAYLRIGYDDKLNGMEMENDTNLNDEKSKDTMTSPKAFENNLLRKEGLTVNENNSHFQKDFTVLDINEILYFFNPRLSVAYLERTDQHIGRML